MQARRLTVTFLDYEINLFVFLVRNAQVTMVSLLLGLIIYHPASGAAAASALLGAMGVDAANVMSVWSFFGVLSLATGLTMLYMPWMTGRRVKAAVADFRSRRLAPVDFEVSLIRAMKTLKWTMLGAPIGAAACWVASLCWLFLGADGFVAGGLFLSASISMLCAHFWAKRAVFAGYSYVWLLGMHAAPNGANPFQARTAREVFEAGRVCGEYRPDQMHRDLTAIVPVAIARLR
jgi:hypothetical protein